MNHTYSPLNFELKALFLLACLFAHSLSSTSQVSLLSTMMPHCSFGDPTHNIVICRAPNPDTRNFVASRGPCCLAAGIALFPIHAPAVLAYSTTDIYPPSFSPRLLV